MLIRFALLLVLLSSGPALAAPQASLPPHWSHHHPEEDEEDYRQPRPLTGVSGHGFAEPGPSADGETPLCLGSEDEQVKLANTVPYATEFWFYATEAQAVLFRRTAHIAPDKPCAQALGYRHSIDRAFVTDGLIHSFEVEDGDLTQAQTRPVDTSDGQYSGAFRTIHNLMAKTQIPSGRRSSADRVAGVRVRCGHMPGIVWSRTCVASSGRLSGMILSTAAGDDEREMFHLAFDRIDSRALLDGRLFQTDRAWMAQE